MDAAGSLSSGFFATPGLGIIDLEWTDPDETELADLLGYEMYRYTIDENSISSDTVQINGNLINEPLYTDFEVEPGQLAVEQILR